MRGISSVGPDGSGPCGLGSSVLWRNFRRRICTHIPQCSLWHECGFHGYVPVVSPACCEVSPMLLDLHVLWRHNCRLSVCCDAPLLGERTSHRVNWVGVAFIKCRRWCHCCLYFCVLPCLTRTMYGFETYSGLKQASRMGGVWGSSYSHTFMPSGAVLRNVCIHIFSLFFLTSVVRSGWPAIRLRIVGIGCACVAAVLCEFRLKCLATGVSIMSDVSEMFLESC